MLSARKANRILHKDVTKDVFVFDSPILRRVVLVYNNPEYVPHFQRKGFCYAIVHAGFSLVDDHEAQNLVVDGDEYGNYQDYIKNIKRLIKRLKKSDVLSLFFVDEDYFYGKDAYSSDFLPSTSNLILVTEEDKGKLKEPLGTSDNHNVDLNQEKIYSFLKSAGIKEILLAGEWVYSPVVAGMYKMGCLGTVAKSFQENRFEVKGIKGCLYPSVSQIDIPNFDSELLMKLYQEQVDPRF